MIPCDQMPWEWFAKICKARGRKKRYQVTVNGKPFLVAYSSSELQLLRGLRLPERAAVSVNRII